ncbi:hypothetical protein Mapa_010115 [Marchantia paleacea]|nr:hypothetical protein Mapa_010115 [Marchantia paleacea]
MGKLMVWVGVAVAVTVRFVFAAMGAQDRLGRRVEIVTPVTSLMRLAEGQWFKQLGLSPYAGSAYHGSPLLLALLGPMTTVGTGGQISSRFHSSLIVFVIADLLGAMLLLKMGNLVESANGYYLAKLLLDSKTSKPPVKTQVNDIRGHGKLGLGEVAALLYLVNPFTVAVCVGGTTSPIENVLVLLALYGALKGNSPLAAFGWAMSTHLSMYPAVLLIPISILMVAGPDKPQRKLFEHVNKVETSSLKFKEKKMTGTTFTVQLQWARYRDFLLFSALWWIAILGLSAAALGGHEHLKEMLFETYGFILHVEDLSPNLGLFWYFFTEVFTHFRDFFIMVFHANILFVLVPLTIRLHHRPLFLAYVMVAITTMLKSYPSIGDAAISLGLLGLCTPELADFRFSFFVLNGYLVVAILSPSMYNLWIWRGTGNANFYFAMALVYACVQSILIIESVGTVIRHDRNLDRLSKLAVQEDSGAQSKED